MNFVKIIGTKDSPAKKYLTPVMGSGSKEDE
jgi:hypothetical protein